MSAPWAQVQWTSRAEYSHKKVEIQFAEGSFTLLFPKSSSMLHLHNDLSFTNLFIRTKLLPLGVQETLLISSLFCFTAVPPTCKQVGCYDSHSCSKYLWCGNTSCRDEALLGAGAVHVYRNSHSPIPQVQIQVKVMGGGIRSKTIAHSSV